MEPKNIKKLEGNHYLSNQEPEAHITVTGAPFLKNGKKPPGGPKAG